VGATYPHKNFLISTDMVTAIAPLQEPQVMKNSFRKYHRQIATLFCLPILFTALTGMSVAIADTWLHQAELAAFLINVHTFQIFNLDAILPVINGLGLIGLAATGLSMTGLFAKRRQPRQLGERL
jgi:hypothetical protein